MIPKNNIYVILLMISEIVHYVNIHRMVNAIYSFISAVLEMHRKMPAKK